MKDETTYLGREGNLRKRSQRQRCADFGVQEKNYHKRMGRGTVYGSEKGGDLLGNTELVT